MVHLIKKNIYLYTLVYIWSTHRCAIYVKAGSRVGCLRKGLETTNKDLRLESFLQRQIDQMEQNKEKKIF